MLNLAGELIKGGLHPSDILKGYENAWTRCFELIENAPKFKLSDLRNVDEVTKIIRPAIGSKLLSGQDLILAPLIAQACITVLTSKPEYFNNENVRVAKILGGSLIDSHVVKGLVVVRLVEGSVTSVSVFYYFLNLELQSRCV